MPGLEEYRYWTLIPIADCPLYWLQCEAEPALALPLADAPAVLPDYAFELSTADVHALDLRAAEEALVLVVLTVPADGGAITANLLAPVVANVRTRAPASHTHLRAHETVLDLVCRLLLGKKT